MNKFVVSRNLHRDPMTNLKNFIQFLEEDYALLFGDAGKIIMFEIEGLKEVNLSLGYDVGDVMIRTAAHAICQHFNRESVYRMEGAVFGVFLKEDTVESDEPEKLTAQLYNALMQEKGYSELTLNPITYIYHQSIGSVEDYYMFIMDEDHRRNIKYTFEGDSFLRHILSNAINRVRMSFEYYEEVYNFALIDEVSGLPNAKAANEYLSKMTTSTGRKSDIYTVFFIDGDDLRKYNDISYKAGNDMIRRLADLIKEAIRSEDKVFRWLSGDEFLVMLEGTDVYTGERLAERIRSRIDEASEDFTFKTTVSIGVASYPADGRDVDTIIYYAEKANKLAKDRGKNQVVTWHEVDVATIGIEED